MELRKNYRKLTTALSRFWHREAGPMNWKNPVRVVAYIGWEIFNGVAFLVGEWVRYGVRAGQIFLAIPPTVILFFGGGWFAVWSFVRRPFPALETVPLLDLLEYHNPNFYSAVVLWYYLSPLVAVMLAGSIFLSVWKVWIEARKRDLIPFGALPAWPLSPEQPGPEIVIGEVHHPVEPKEIFNPEWLTIPERGLYTGIAIFGAVGSGKTSACMHPFAKQLLGWQADDPEKRAAALMLEVKGDFCHDIRSILDGGPGRRLPGDRNGGPLEMESPLRVVARFVLAGLHRCQPSESTFRQGQGALLAASLYQSGALDYRASPGATGAVGDIAAGLSMRD